MAYKLSKVGGIIRLADGASIPDCMENRDWQEYREWVAKGNTPDPAETPEDIAEREAREAKVVALAQAIEDNLPSFAQLMTACDNIRNLVEAKAFIKKLAAVVYIHVKGDSEQEHLEKFQKTLSIDHNAYQREPT